MGVLTTIPRDSTKGIGGLCYVLLANYGDVNVSVDSSMNTTFTDGDASVGNAFTKFVLTKETGNFASPVTGTPTAGTTSFNHTLNLTFARNEALKLNQLRVMGASELIAVAVDRNGDAWCLGNDGCSGLDLTGGDAVSGAGPNDLSGVTVVLSANQKYPISAVSSVELAAITPA